VDDLVESLQQPEQQQKQMLVQMTPELLNTLVDKDEFRDTDLLNIPQLKKASSFYNKTVALANTKREDFFHYRERLKDLKVQRMMSVREEEYTWQEDYLWGCFENWFEFELTRSEGGFERLTQATQIQQNVQSIGNNNQQQSGGGGLLGWASRALGGGRR